MSSTKFSQPMNIAGFTSEGDHVKNITIRSSDGMTASILTLGARLVDLRLANDMPLTLSFNNPKDVEDDRAYVGVAVGRTANRIRSGQLSRHRDIDQRAFLEKNDQGKNHIHGGRRAWDKRLFAVRHLSDSAVELFMFSPDGDQGYPSSVNVSVRYEFSGTSQLCVSLTTTNIGPEQTVTNMTLHPYFDLTGRGGTVRDAVCSYVVCAPMCNHYLVLDKDNLPTGDIASVENTRFDLRKPRKIHNNVEVFPGYDHYFVAGHEAPLDAPLRSLITLTAPAGEHGQGVEMEVLSNQPGFQMYTANGFDGSGPQSFAQYGSIAIEPSGFIDAANNPAFPTIALGPTQTRRQIIVYKIRGVEAWRTMACN